MTCLLDRTKITDKRKGTEGEVKVLLDAPWLMLCTLLHLGEILTATINISLVVNVFRAYSFGAVLPYFILSRAVLYTFAFVYREESTMKKVCSLAVDSPFQTTTKVIGGIFHNSIWKNKTMFVFGLALSFFECAFVTGLVGFGNISALYGTDYAPKLPFILLTWIGMSFQFLCSCGYLKLHDGWASQTAQATSNPEIPQV